MDRRLLGAGEQFTGVRAAQVGVRLRALQPEPDQADRRGSRARAEGETAVQAEVDVQPGTGLEAEEQVLAVRLRLAEPLTVDQRGALREPALRAGDPERAVRERLGVLGRETVDDVALGHGRSPSDGCVTTIRFSQAGPTVPAGQYGRGGVPGCAGG
ncbi:hypothetical protein GCM10009664_14980 [Kitasatospora gansuensis]